MVHPKYYLNIITQNGIPFRCVYIKDEIIVGSNQFEDTSHTGPVDNKNEYYAEYDNCGVFIYTDNKTNMIIRKETWVQNVNYIKESYKPKKTIRYN